MAIQGLRTASNFVTDQRPKNWREGIHLIYPNGQLGLTGLTGLMKSATVDDPEFYWWEKILNERRFPLAASIDNAAGTQVWTVTSANDAKSLKTGDVLRVEQTGELVRVMADPVDSTHLTVLRGFAATTKTAVTYNGAGINPNILVVGSAFEEGSLAPTGVNFDSVKTYNLTQIFRSTLEITRTAAKTRLRTGDAVKEAKRECLEYFGVDMERAFIFGVRSESNVNGKIIRTTDGIVAKIPSGNKRAIDSLYSSGLKLENLETELELLFRWGSSEKMAFVGNLALLAINQAIRKGGQLQLMPAEKEYGGLMVQRLITPWGVLVLKTHPLFNQNLGGTTGGTAYFGMNSWMLVIDMAELKYRYITDVEYQKDLQENGLDGEKAGYLAECGLEFGNANAHVLWTGFSKGIAES